MTWTQNQTQFTEAAKECVVVTHEQHDKNIKRKVKIPNVCQAFDIRYIDTFQMIRELGVRLG